VLVTSEETAVPLTLVNAGQRAWDPGSIHLSYHWLWIVPREFAHRSRTVPYHDGIRTELGDRTIPPGAGVVVRGRLLAPDVPGAYWLQWDMVEEGVTWFTQVAPRQRRTLVVVVPPIAWALAPLPLAAAIFALYAGRPDQGRTGEGESLARRGAVLAVADALWCASALAVKPLILAHDALLEPSAVAYWLVLAIAAAVPALAVLVLPQRIRPWLLLGVGIVASLILLADVVYYRFFGDVLSTPALLAAHQTHHVWGSIGGLVSPGLVWLVADWPLAIWLAARVSHAAPPARRVRALTAIAALLVVGLAGAALSARRALASAPLDQMFRARAAMEQLGPLGYHAYDAWTYARVTWLHPPASDAEVAEARAWFRERAPLRAGGPGFGAARGRSLIVLQVESLQDFAVDFRVYGQEVMPHLRRWVSDGLRFTSVTDETSEGRTSDAEFAAMTSLLPLDHGAVAFRFPGNHYTALPRVLRGRGYATLSAVPFEPGFWNRQVMHPAYGFTHSLFEPDFQMTEQIGWGLNDRDFLRQMVPRLERLPRPFAAWLITLSLHHPFESFPDAHKALTLGPLEGSSLGNYLHAMRFFDDALEEFRAALARDGLLDQSLVVVFGDHDAGFARDPALARTMGIGGDAAAWALNDRVPFFIRTGAANDGTLTGVRAAPAGQTDFAPTVLSLLGIDAAPLPYVGRNLLGAPGDVPVPRPYGDWLDARHMFFAGAGAVCYDVIHGAADAADRCSAADRVARRTRDISRLVVIDDLQERLTR
jgi:phosphoglycerol transferase MdoB-like AlkP superfamily enzyme